MRSGTEQATPLREAKDCGTREYDRPLREIKGIGAPVGLTFHDPLAIFTIELLQRSRLILSRTSSLFP